MARLKLSLVDLDKIDLVVKGLSNSRFMGGYASVFKGRGLEFSNFRAFMPDDDANNIDWKTSARLNHPVVKEYIEERDIEVFFLIDVSSKMITGSTPRLKCEYIADFVASLSHFVLKTGDKVGIGLFSDKMKGVIYPNNGIKHFYFISDMLSNLSYYGGGCDIQKAINFAVRFLRKGAIVFLVSDFITNEDLDNALRIAGQKFDMIAVVVRDPVDLELPKGLGEVLVEAPDSGEKIVVKPGKIAKYYGHEAKVQLRKIEKSFLKNRVSLLELNTGKSFSESLIRFFEKRRKLWR